MMTLSMNSENKQPKHFKIYLSAVMENSQKPNKKKIPLKSKISDWTNFHFNLILIFNLKINSSHFLLQKLIRFFHVSTSHVADVEKFVPKKRT